MNNTGKYYILNSYDEMAYSERYGRIICGDIEQRVE